MRAFIVPGWKATPDSNWFQSLARSLRAAGIPTEVLRMPHRHVPVLASWSGVLSKAVGVPDSETVLIGHSAGSAAILRYLERLPDGMGVGGCVLVSAFPHALFHPKLPHVLTRRPKSRRIASKCRWLLAVTSDDDWRVPLSNGEWLAKELGAQVVMIENAGHFTGEALPNELVSRIIDLILAGNE